MQITFDGENCFWWSFHLQARERKGGFSTSITHRWELIRLLTYVDFHSNSDMLFTAIKEQIGSDLWSYRPLPFQYFTIFKFNFNSFPHSHSLAPSPSLHQTHISEIWYLKEREYAWNTREKSRDSVSGFISLSVKYTCLLIRTYLEQCTNELEIFYVRKF